ncbi:hypothetical protein LX32DRAFT_643346 [Colletotrichum zoysiae]|uniref:Uncharacterized protein n=1 Tax=Colletotrichum zoysiae TaxID=1216348 RepID=A0AAD9H982_9PEZI|nr:hypothetical protein LX32DRAFT_643346 [Colletotrichum zoysiae]
MSDYPIRPPTPQAMLHRLPDKPDDDELSRRASTKPSKYIILIVASTAVAGKVQIAKSVASALACPLFQGDSLHETAAKAANLGASRGPAGAAAADNGACPGPNEGRYQRMWLSKMTRTGLLFPEESRPANEGFSGFGGASSTSTSRRGSGSSVASASSDALAAASTASIASSFTSSGGGVPPPPPPTAKYINKPVTSAPLPDDELLRRANPALMVVTHPELERWHKDCIRKTVGEYRIGVIFVPLGESDDDDDDDDDDELPVLKPLDPRTMTSFASLGPFVASGTGSGRGGGGSLEEEMVLRVNVDADVEHLIEEIVDGVREIMGPEEGVAV